MTLTHEAGDAGPVASAGGALQSAFDQSFPLEGLSEVNRSILSRGRSGMVEELLHADLARIDEEFGDGAGPGNGAEVRRKVRAIVADGSFSRAGGFIQKLLNDRRKEEEAGVRVLEQEFSKRLETIASRIDARAGIYGDLWDGLYGPKAVLLSKLVGY